MTTVSKGCSGKNGAQKLWKSANRAPSSAVTKVDFRQDHIASQGSVHIEVTANSTLFWANLLCGDGYAIAPCCRRVNGSGRSSAVICGIDQWHKFSQHVMEGSSQNLDKKSKQAKRTVTGSSLNCIDRFLFSPPI